MIGDVDGNGVGSGGIIVDKDACRVIGIVASFSGIANVIFNINGKFFVIVAAEWLVGAGSCSWCCRLVSLSGAAMSPLTMTFVSLSLLLSTVVYCSL